MLSDLGRMYVSSIARNPKLTLRDLPATFGKPAHHIAEILGYKLVDLWPFADEPMCRVLACGHIGPVSNYPRYKGMTGMQIMNIAFSKQWMHETVLEALAKGCSYEELDDWISDEWISQYNKITPLRDYVQPDDYKEDPSIVAARNEALDDMEEYNAR